MVLLTSFPGVIAEAARVYDPHTLPTIVIPLAKEFHRFYHEVRIWGLQPMKKKKISDWESAKLQLKYYKKE